MTDTGIVLAAVAVFCIAYPHVLYPALLIAMHKRMRRPVLSGNVTEPATIVIAAYNERDCIESCLTTLRASTSRPERFDVVVADDGSTDGTAEVIEALAPSLLPMRVRLLRCARGGKNAALRQAMRLVSADLVVFADADIRVGPGVVDALLASFADSTVGAVISVNDRSSAMHSEPGAYQEALYRRIEASVNIMESDISSTVTSNGPLYAVRRNCLEPIPDGRVADDWWNVLCAIQHGKRVVIAKDARIVEYRPNTMAREFHRTIRTASAGMRCLWSMRGLLHPSFGSTSWFLWSHRVMRWAGPLFFALLAASTVMVRDHEVIFGVLFYGQIVMILGAILGHLAERSNVRVPLLGIIQYFLLMNAAFVLAALKAARGVTLDTWTPSAGEGPA